MLKIKDETVQLSIVQDAINSIEQNNDIIVEELKKLKKQRKDILKKYNYFDENNYTFYLCDEFSLQYNDYYIKKDLQKVYYRDYGNEFKVNMKYLLNGVDNITDKFSFDLIDKVVISNTEFNLVYNKEKHLEIIKLDYYISKYNYTSNRKSNVEDLLSTIKEYDYDYTYEESNCTYTIFNDKKTFYYYHTTGKWRVKGKDKYYRSKNLKQIFEILK